MRRVLDLIYAVPRFYEGLRAGDPVALGLLGFVGLLLLLAGTIWLIDRRNQARERSVGRRPAKVRPR